MITEEKYQRQTHNSFFKKVPNSEFFSLLEKEEK